MNGDDFTIEITFPDGKVSLNGGDQFFVSSKEGASVLLNDERLRLIRLVREAEIEACEAGA